MAQAYKVGVALALSSNHAQVLGALSQHLLGVHASVAQLQNRFSGLGTVIGGAFAMITGGLILKGIKDIILETADLSQELAKIQMLGVSAQETARLRQQAGAIASRTPAMTSRDVLSVYGQTYSMLGDEEAKKLMEPLARFKSAMVGVSGKAVTDEQLLEITRAADLLGRLNDPKTGKYDEARFKHFIDLAAQTYSSTHGVVGPREWYMMGKTGGPAFMGQSDRGLMTGAIMSQMQGAYRTGTAEMSLYQQFIGGRMTRQSAEALKELGILSSGDIAEHAARGMGHHLHAAHGPRGVGRATGGSEGGHMNLLTPAAQRKLAEFLGDNPLEAAGRMRMQMETRGITDPQEQLKEIFKIFGRQTTQRLMADIVRSFTQITGEIGRLETSADVDAIIKIAHDTSIPYNLNELNAAWKEMLYTLSDSTNSLVVGWLHGFTSTIKGLNTVIQGVNPTVLTALAGGLAAIGVLLVGAGAVAILAALGVGGWLVLGIGALGAVLAVIPWKAAFDTIVGGLNRFHERLQAIWKWLVSILPAMGWGPARDEAGHMKNPGSLDKYIWEGGPAKNPPGLTDSYGNWSPAQKLGAGMMPISYRQGGDALGTLVIDGPIGMVVFSDRALAGVGGRGGGGGISRASYSSYGNSLGGGGGGGSVPRMLGGGGGGGTPGGGGGGGTPGIGRAPSIGKGDDPRGMVPYIREMATKYGIDPDTAVAVAKSEGLRDFSGDGRTSFGAFQLHTGGGLGDEFKKQTGLDPSDPKNEKATIDWAMKNLGRTGWGPYHGARRSGIGNRAGIGGGGAGGGAGHANFMGGLLPGKGGMTMIETLGGHRMTVNKASAPYLKGFVEDLERAGAPFSSIGGFNERHIAGSSRWSQHAYGNAIDIDQHARNIVSPKFGAWARSHPNELRAALNKHGIISGGDWKNPDFGHFEWGGSEMAKHGSSLRDHFGYRGRHNPEHPSGAIPPPSSGAIQIHHTTNLDGQVVARNSMKHIVGGLNSPAKGGRMPDFSSARPVSI